MRSSERSCGIERVRFCTQRSTACAETDTSRPCRPRTRPEEHTHDGSVCKVGRGAGRMATFLSVRAHVTLGRQVVMAHHGRRVLALLPPCPYSPTTRAAIHWSWPVDETAAFSTTSATPCSWRHTLVYRQRKASRPIWPDGRLCRLCSQTVSLSATPRERQRQRPPRAGRRPQDLPWRAGRCPLSWTLPKQLSLSRYRFLALEQPPLSHSSMKTNPLWCHRHYRVLHYPEPHHRPSVARRIERCPFRKPCSTSQTNQERCFPYFCLTRRLSFF